jgi:LuxR family maltose regulon positive regulatory protein
VSLSPPPFATTKIQAPRPRSARLQRPALDAALADALRHARVLLLQAPAGFGKTSALAPPLAAMPAGTALAWLSLDEDDDATRFVACLAAALEPFDLPWRTAPEALATLPLDARGCPTRAITELVNALADAEATHGVIVLDDLHRVQDTALLRGLDLLIERLPAQWTLVISTRVTPPLSLARLRAAGELATFEQERLAFTPEETAGLAAAEGMSAAQATALHERTAGWPAGVRLGLAALRGGAAVSAPSLATPRMDRPLFEFLASEVLDQLPRELHDFLLRVSVLPEFTAAQAAAVSGDGQAAARMDEIERRGLFATALDAPERTLVLHDLFRDALADRLRRQRPDEWVDLLRRAAAITSDPLRRVGLLQRAPDWPAAEDALATAAEDLLLRGGVAQVERCIAGFDATWRSASPTLLRLSAIAAFLRWDWPRCAREAEAAMRAAAPAQARGEPRASAEHALARAYLAAALYPLDRNDEAEAHIAALRADPSIGPHPRLMALMADASQHLRRGQLPELPALYGQVLDLLDANGRAFNWWEATPAVNWTTLPGMRALTQRYLAGAWARVGDEPLPLVADLRVLEAFNHLWAGRLDAAHAAATQAEQDLRWLAVSGEADVGVQLFRLLEGAMRGRADATLARLDRFLARVHAEDRPTPERVRLWQHQVATYGVRINDMFGRGPAPIAQWAALLKENPLEDPAPDNARAISVRARHAAAEGRWPDAAHLFGQLLPRAPRMDVMGQALEVQLRAAHALMHCGQLDAAAAALRQALARIQRDGEQGQALLASAPVLRALERTAWAGRLAPHEQALLSTLAALAAEASEVPARPHAAVATAATVPPRVPAASAPCGERGSSLAEALSEREREVLEALAEGQSNKLIARELDISPHTVKRHVANILDKLGLASRGQAAAWLRHHGNT